MRRQIGLIAVLALLAMLGGCALTPTLAPQEPAFDETPPLISEVLSSDIACTTAVITWKTNEPATSQVQCGETDQYGSTTPLDETLVTNHRVVLTGLKPGTKYYFRAKSMDAANNKAGSREFTFTTSLDAETLFQEGQKLEQEEKYEDAISKYQRVIDEYPDSPYVFEAKEAVPECYCLWGLQLEGAGKYSEAIEKYRLLLDEYPDSHCRSNLSRVTEDSPKIEKIIEVISCYPGLSWADCKVRNKSQHYVIEVTVELQLYHKGKKVFSLPIQVYDLEPGEEGSGIQRYPKVYQPAPALPTIVFDDYECNVTEVWYR